MSEEYWCPLCGGPHTIYNISAEDAFALAVATDLLRVESKDTHRAKEQYAEALSRLKESMAADKEILEQ